MTTITGTEKQVRWATEIRDSKLAEIRTLRRNAVNAPANVLAAVDAYLDVIAAESSAQALIDNRDTLAAYEMIQWIKASQQGVVTSRTGRFGEIDDLEGIESTWAI